MSIRIPFILSCIIAFVPISLFAAETATEENRSAYSFYLISCGNYIEHRDFGKSPNEKIADSYYVAGWLSAYNRLNPAASNITEDSDLESIMLWLEKYCRDNPLSNLETGLFQLAQDTHQAPAPANTQSKPTPPKTTPQKPALNLREIPVN